MTQRKTIRVRDLKDLMTSPFEGPTPFLYCAMCGGEYSANSGDYFLARPDSVFTCCREPMQLVVKRVRYQEVRP